MIIPVIMGLVVDLVGLEEAFALLGAVLIGICILVALVVLRIPAFKT